MNSTPPIDEAMKAEALNRPNGHLYVIDPSYSSGDENGHVPPEGIIGAYPIDALGQIVPDFQFNPRYVEASDR